MLWQIMSSSVSEDDSSLSSTVYALKSKERSIPHQTKGDIVHNSTPGSENVTENVTRSVPKFKQKVQEIPDEIIGKGYFVCKLRLKSLNDTADNNDIDCKTLQDNF